MQHALLHFLSDGKFHSGTELASQLGISRTAVWKKISKLESDYKIRVHSVRGKGYRLPAPLRLLKHEEIWQRLKDTTKTRLPRVDLQLVVGSTNEIAKENRSPAPYVCLAEAQTAGRGRRGRNWVSPFGKNLYLSLRWQFSEGAAVHHGLSLCVGIALVRVVQRAGLSSAKIKWPNDLVCEGRKIAGILLEAVGEIAGDVTVIIGIGINVDMDVDEGGEIDQDWSTLSRELAAEVNRNWLAAELLNELVSVLELFQQYGFQYFREEWQGHDALYGRRVTLHSANNKAVGIAKGVTATGALVLESESGRSVHDSGEVSARVS